MTNRLSRPLLAALLAAAALVVVSADAEASPGPASLKRAVRSYSTAFLSGDSGRAWHMLTARCRHRLDRDEFAAIVRAAHARYGRAKLRSIRVEVRGNLGRATYRFSAHALDQVREPWAVERGAWREDDC